MMSNGRSMMEEKRGPDDVEWSMTEEKRGPDDVEPWQKKTPLEMENREMGNVMMRGKKKKMMGDGRLGGNL